MDAEAQERVEGAYAALESAVEETLGVGELLEVRLPAGTAKRAPGGVRVEWAARAG